MRRKIVIPIVLVAAVIALLVGVLVVPARGSASATKTVAAKTTPTPLELFAKVAATLPSTTAVHGQFTWTNNLLGSSFQLPADAPAILTDLWKSGTGQFWFQDGKVRLEVGNITVVENGVSVWVYDSTSKTATQYALPARGQKKAGMGMSAKPGPGRNGFNLGSLGNLSTLMSAVDLKVTTDTVAGQGAYVLTITPTARNTTLGSIEVAFDGTTFVPLSVKVTDNGRATVLDAAMTSVDYNTVDASQFDYAPPTGATIVQGNLKAHLNKGGMHKSMGVDGMGPNGTAKLKGMMRSLTVAQAQAKVRFPLLSLTSRMTDLPFQGANVAAHKNPGPFAILRYGKGFGTVVLAEGKLTDAQRTQVLNALGATKLGTPATVGSSPGTQGTDVTTPLVNAFIWTTKGVFHVAAGPVPMTSLESFVTNLK
jgi:outer membrane lipoprotein-sorting protein